MAKNNNLTEYVIRYDSDNLRQRSNRGHTRVFDPSVIVHLSLFRVEQWMDGQFAEKAKLNLGSFNQFSWEGLYLSAALPCLLKLQALL